MISKAACALIAILSMIACNIGSDNARHEYNDLGAQIERLDQTLDSIADAAKLPGFGITLITEDSVLMNKGYGWADVENKIPFSKDTRHTIASISKTTIAISILQLVELGRINLEQEINTILPFKIHHPGFPDVPIRIKHLVTHSSGINDDFDDGEKRASWLIEEAGSPEAYSENIQSDIDYYDGSESTLREYLESFLTPSGRWYQTSNFSEFKPGELYEYSNSGATVAAYLVELYRG